MPEITKEQLYIILGIIAVVLLGCVVGVYNQNMASKRSSPESSPAVVLPESKGKIEPISNYVHISGAVIREGVYRLNRGDRLIDLIQLSGAASNADLDSVNLAEVLTDGQKVLIPKKTIKIATENGISTASGPNKASKIININTADEKAMDSLPGIGPVMAKRIVDYRSENGRFSSVEELKEVPGISEKKFGNLKKHISVN
jgi:competence protein ComEA